MLQNTQLSDMQTHRGKAKATATRAVASLMTQARRCTCVFNSTEVDYARPVNIKNALVRKPIVTKCYVAVLVSLSIKAVHLEPVTEPTTSAFIATLGRFIARRGIPSTLWSDNGTNFFSVAKEIRKLVSNPEVHDNCTHQGIHTVEVGTGVRAPLWQILGGCG